LRTEFAIDEIGSKSYVNTEPQRDTHQGEGMINKHFENPVFVRNSDAVVQEIAQLEDALYFLEDWPEKRRGPIYETARRACMAAFDGHFPVASARKAFVGWARSANVLEGDDLKVMPWMIMPRSGRGGRRI
jgi:Protein of unknown function (DUF982)